MDTDTDELSDLTTDACYHPPGERVYYAAPLPAEDDLPERMAWVVDCGYCGERLAHGWDAV